MVRISITTLILCACTNSGAPTKNRNQYYNDPTSSPTSSPTPFFSIQDVNVNNAQRIIDISGDDTQNLNAACAVLTNNGYQCECLFNFLLSNGASTILDQPVIYAERNMVRCSFASLPNGINNFKLTVRQTSTQSVTDPAVSVSVNPLFFDFSTLSSYSVILPFTCKYAHIVQNIFGYFNNSQKVYDPSQSANVSDVIESRHFFYTNNFANSVTGYVQSQAKAIQANPGSTLSDFWDCPFALDIDYASQFTTGGSSSSNNPIYSIQPAKVLLQDVQFNVTKSSSSAALNTTQLQKILQVKFYLAPSVVGPFTEKVLARLAPGGDPQLLGYAVKPQFNQTQNPCSSNITVPTGLQWNKLWLFKRNASSLKSCNSTATASAGSTQGANVICDPLLPATVPTGTVVWSSCPNNTPTSCIALGQITTKNDAVTRIMQYNINDLQSLNWSYRIQRSNTNASFPTLSYQVGITDPAQQGQYSGAKAPFGNWNCVTSDTCPSVLNVENQTIQCSPIQVQGGLPNDYVFLLTPVQADIITQFTLGGNMYGISNQGIEVPAGSDPGAIYPLCVLTSQN